MTREVADPAGALIVSAPQDMALADARRGVKMFEKVGVNIIGLVENMSYFCCPACGHRAEIFGHGGARGSRAARRAFPGRNSAPRRRARKRRRWHADRDQRPQRARRRRRSRRSPARFKPRWGVRKVKNFLFLKKKKQKKTFVLGSWGGERRAP